MASVFTAESISYSGQSFKLSYPPTRLSLEQRGHECKNLHSDYEAVRGKLFNKRSAFDV